MSALSAQREREMKPSATHPVLNFALTSMGNWLLAPADMVVEGRKGDAHGDEDDGEDDIATVRGSS